MNCCAGNLLKFITVLSSVYFGYYIRLERPLTYEIKDCMHVASEPGDYIFKKQPTRAELLELDSIKNKQNLNVDSDTTESVAQTENTVPVCGLYVVGKPDTVVEITMKQYDVNCDYGGLMAFVDGWELNGEYFPSIEDHHRSLEDRVQEFCNNRRQWPRLTNKQFFRSTQNAALLQYRIPFRGSFIANVRFHKISQPCNVLVQDTQLFFRLSNYGQARNCSLSALFPAVVNLNNFWIGSKNVRQEKPNYDCGLLDDRLEIGGSAGLDTAAMKKSSNICGYSSKPGPVQAIYCGFTTIRLVSTGRYKNRALIMIRQADERDLDIATLICGL